MKKILLYSGLGLIIGPIIADIIFALTMVIVGVSGKGDTGSILAVSLIATFGGVLCVAATIMMIIVGAVLIILSSAKDSKKKQGV